MLTAALTLPRIARFKELTASSQWLPRFSRAFETRLTNARSFSLGLDLKVPIPSKQRSEMWQNGLLSGEELRSDGGETRHQTSEYYSDTRSDEDAFWSDESFQHASENEQESPDVVRYLTFFSDTLSQLHGLISSLSPSYDAVRRTSEKPLVIPSQLVTALDGLALAPAEISRQRRLETEHKKPVRVRAQPKAGRESSLKATESDNRFRFVVADHPDKLKDQDTLRKNRQHVMQDYLAKEAGGIKVPSYSRRRRSPVPKGYPRRRRPIVLPATNNQWPDTMQLMSFVRHHGSAMNDFTKKAPENARVPSGEKEEILIKTDAPSGLVGERSRIMEKSVDKSMTRSDTKDKMWTEVSKDLVIKEAIDEMGYEYEETEDLFYFIEYLRYEDVLRLVEITEDIRRERRERVREIQWEREELERMPKTLLTPPPPVSTSPGGMYDEPIYEQDYV